jgi:hypothetical protein
MLEVALITLKEATKTSSKGIERVLGKLLEASF